ncbi:MAG: hypothetical protein KJT03_12045, partial [Verrucomicrobiae bacterium]|nr:hypothetical protein [Verrucomicrobiae bacterium]
ASVFEDVAHLKPAKGFMPVELNTPVWLPDVQSRQWLNVPAGETITFSEWEHWRLPKDAMWVQHFDNNRGQPHETHVYWSNGDGTFRAAAYRWSSDSSDPELISSGGITTVTGTQNAAWFSPGPEQHLNPKLALIGFVPQINTRQLNRGDQLLELSRKGWLDTQVSARDLKALPQMASLDDPQASVDWKARSYLDANCAVCHQPGGPSRGTFDVRFSTPMEERLLLSAEPVAGNLDVEGATLLEPGSPERSILYLRMNRTDAFRMPPVAVHGELSPALPVIERWIREMKPPESASR